MLCGCCSSSSVASFFRKNHQKERNFQFNCRTRGKVVLSGGAAGAAIGDWMTVLPILINQLPIFTIFTTFGEIGHLTGKKEEGRVEAKKEKGRSGHIIFTFFLLLYCSSQRSRSGHSQQYLPPPTGQKKEKQWEGQELPYARMYIGAERVGFVWCGWGWAAPEHWYLASLSLPRRVVARQVPSSAQTVQ